MLLVNRLKDNQNFSDSETKIANYVLNNPQKVVAMTIHELSKVTYASAATITRFCRKLDNTGFSDFKLQLARELNTFNLSSERIEDNLPFDQQDTHQDIAQNILNLNIQTMVDTYNSFDLTQMIRVARILHDAKTINFFGEGQSLLLCEDFQYKLYRIGIDANVVVQNGFQIMKSASLPTDSAVLMISYYGHGKPNLRIAKTLKERGIPFILITGPHQNPLIEYASEVIQVPSEEELNTKMASYSSRTAIQLVIDVLYAIIFSFDYEKYQNLIQAQK